MYFKLLTLLIVSLVSNIHSTFHTVNLPIATIGTLNISITGEDDPSTPSNEKVWTAYIVVQLNTTTPTTTTVDVQLTNITGTTQLSTTIIVSPNQIQKTFIYYNVPAWADTVKLLPTKTALVDSRIVPITYSGPAFSLLIPNHNDSQGAITKFTNRSQAPIQMIGYGDRFEFQFTKLDGSSFTTTYVTEGVKTSELVCAFGPDQNWSCPAWPNYLPNGKYVVTITVTTVGRGSVTETREIWMGIHTYLPIITR